MNSGTPAGLIARAFHRAFLTARHLLPHPNTSTISTEAGIHAIGRVYVINLDRQDERWRHMQRELKRVHDDNGRPLTAVTRRFSAVDARHFDGAPPVDTVTTTYSLADQLFVDPQPLSGSDSAFRERVEMSRQEIAVALSHVGVWKAISTGPPGYTLILEDDAYFRPLFTRLLDGAWADLKAVRKDAPADVIYLSYEEARSGAAKEPVSKLLFRPAAGLWCLSGYVLSRRGATKLLGLLPVCGPVDLWINHQFENLDVFATAKPLVKQRRDFGSGNEYSILPVLSKVGLITKEKPLLFEPSHLPTPVIGVGERGTGLTSLAMALSMLGYRCCSDVRSFPGDERSRLFSDKKPIFDAYVNVGSLNARACTSLARLYPDARFIITKADGDTVPQWAELLENFTQSVLVIPSDHADKWELLSRFLGLDYPSYPYPVCPDRALREPLQSQARPNVEARSFAASTLQADRSPWTIRRRDWRGMRLAKTDGRHSEGLAFDIAHAEHRQFDLESFTRRDDTFPSNLALFRPSNVLASSKGVTCLRMREEITAVRELTAASICSRERYLYGRYRADIRPSEVSGAISGLFLHRNRPRQEIDIEFLGSEPTKMLVNVFYNPGLEGTKMEYGYRGTPVLVDLGFDASVDFHRYEIAWNEDSIQWSVDGALVHERVCWNPTPIPHLPMQLNVNIWHSRSEELAGPLDRDNLPTVTAFKRLEVSAQRAYPISSRRPALSS